MGEFANVVQDYVCESLANQYSAGRWMTEYTLGETPVDIGGGDDNHLYLIELEWRRADPADNAAKIFRHIDADKVGAEQVTLFQVFTEYYNLSRGGVSSKRKNAEFVGRVAAQALEKLSYAPIEFNLEPPKQKEDWPETWKATADKTVTTICDKIES